MSPPEVEVEGVHYDTIDINIIPDSYVTWIVDVWTGNRNDPAVGVTRYIGVWRGEDLEDAEGNAIDPDFSQLSERRYSWDRQIKPHPLHWHALETVKESEGDARSFKNDVESMSPDNRSYTYNSKLRRKAELYQEFLKAIDILAASPEDVYAWAAVEAWRQHNAQLHEK